jgi:hypothetical protein
MPSAPNPPRKAVRRPSAGSQTVKILFFKKEQKKTSFLKKRSKKLLSFGAGGQHGAPA